MISKTYSLFDSRAQHFLIVIVPQLWGACLSCHKCVVLENCLYRYRTYHCLRPRTIILTLVVDATGERRPWSRHTGAHKQSSECLSIAAKQELIGLRKFAFMMLTHLLTVPRFDGELVRSTRYSSSCKPPTLAVNSYWIIIIIKYRNSSRAKNCQMS